MAELIRMPRLSDTMQTGHIRVWHKKVGDQVKPGDVLAEVETDKATMDLEAFQEGTLLHIAIAEGQVEVDGLIAIIGKAGEDISGLLLEPSKTSKTSTPASAPNSEPEVKLKETINPASASQEIRIKASPLAKSMAKEAGLDLNVVTGSGENGRIIKKDIEHTITRGFQQPTSIAAFQQKGDRSVPVSQMRKTIAQRLSESKFSAPHFYLTMEIDMDQVVLARQQILAIQDTKVSYNDIIVKACAMALRSNPAVNVSWKGESMIYHDDIHIGVAVAIEDGLVVPVIKNTDLKTISEIREEIMDKAARAKSRKLGLDEMQGNTFTISNLGMFDIEEFTAIINPPDACILAIGSIIKKPVVKLDQITISNRLKVCLSCDHRAVDGATGAKFLQTLKNMLENPITMLL